MKKKLIYLLLFVFVGFIACDDLEDAIPQRTPEEKPTEEEPSEEEPAKQKYAEKELYVLCEGLFNMNNSTLAHYSLTDGTLDEDFFQTVNKRGLGDTANDMQLYGSKIYIVVNVSSQIEVLDTNTGASVKRIPMFNEKGEARQPRYIDFHDDKAYICSFDGSVARLDTASLELEAFAQAGRNPDGICISNGNIYVSNSGGLDQPNYDTTVSVIDLEKFTETNRIEVGTNPGKIHADKYGDVYVVTRGNYNKEGYGFHRINTKTGRVEQTYGYEVLNFCIEGDLAYIYNYNFASNESWVKVFNVKTELIERENFITDGTQIDTPYGINVNPANGDVYMTNAYQFISWGDVLCFDKEGKLKRRINQIGLNPNCFVFMNQIINNNNN